MCKTIDFYFAELTQIKRHKRHIDKNVLTPQQQEISCCEPLHILIFLVAVLDTSALPLSKAIVRLFALLHIHYVTFLDT